MTIDASELNQLRADLGIAGYKATRAAQVVIRKTAADIAAEAKRLAPVDTGMLRASIGYDVSASGLVAIIGPTVSYGAFVEFGTRRMAPHAYMGPALDRCTPAYVSAMAQIGL
ncbi:MAG: HK97 gp10 family phage protein [Micropruina sp.]|nr:MAG: HK97 gp10 family phage protein [Micropruina sp.]